MTKTHTFDNLTHALNRMTLLVAQGKTVTLVHPKFDGDLWTVVETT